MATLTGGGAKELMPVAGTPLLLWVLRECAASGVDEVLIVAAPHKQDVIDLARVASGKPDMPGRIETIIQREPRGLADAIRHGVGFVSNDPFGVALPDNLFIGDTPALRQTIDAYRDTRKNVVAIVELFPEDADRAGPTAIFPGRAKGDLYEIADIPSKGSRGSTFDLGGRPSGFTGVGRYVFIPDEVFKAIDEVDADTARDAEIDDVPVMQLLLERGRLIGRRIAGDFLDVGLPVGYQSANDRLAVNQKRRFPR